MNSQGPSPHLFWKELECRDGTPYPSEFIEDGRVYRLAHVYETIRKILGNLPITIHSGYRTETWNKHVGGAINSQHLHGLALDIEHVKVSPASMYRQLLRHSVPLGLGGLGLYRTFIHIDIRDTPQLVAWSQYNVEGKTSRG